MMRVLLEEGGMALDFVEVDRIFTLFDVDGNGSMDPEEFKEALLFAADPATATRVAAGTNTLEVAEALGAAAARHVGAEWQ